MLYRLNRMSSLHRLLRKGAYSVLWPMPRIVKENALHAVLGRRLPYSAVEAGDTVIQIGAPWDILKSGRSRFIHFLRRVGDTGTVVVVEPDPVNIKALKEYVERNAIKNLVIVESGAWNRATRLRFLVDPLNPASNLVEDVMESARPDAERFESTEVPVDTIDNIVAREGLGTVKLVSITTNGSENPILEGMAQTQKSLRFVATIGELAEYPLLTDYGYTRFGGDDRGYTYAKDV